MLKSEARIAELLENSGFTADMDVYQQIGEYLAANATYCLPFKIDDDAWCIEDGYVGDGRIYGVELGRNCRGEMNAIFMTDCGWTFELKDIGKTVFHTEEEAAEALQQEAEDGEE